MKTKTIVVEGEADECPEGKPNPHSLLPFPNNCAVMERTADGVAVGRCWFYMPDGHTCPRHGDTRPK